MADSTAGGMGFHYGNTDLIDGNVQVDQPELLLYEPQADGSLELVAVEYITPTTSTPATPPHRCSSGSGPYGSTRSLHCGFQTISQRWPSGS